MTETISPPDSQAVESLHLARPETAVVALRDGRPREIQDCVDQGLAQVDPEPAAG